MSQTIQSRARLPIVSGKCFRQKKKKRIIQRSHIRRDNHRGFFPHPRSSLSLCFFKFSFFSKPPFYFSRLARLLSNRERFATGKFRRLNFSYPRTESTIVVKILLRRMLPEQTTDPVGYSFSFSRLCSTLPSERERERERGIHSSYSFRSKWGNSFGSRGYSPSRKRDSRQWMKFRKPRSLNDDCQNSLRSTPRTLDREGGRSIHRSFEGAIGLVNARPVSFLATFLPWKPLTNTPTLKSLLWSLFALPFSSRENIRNVSPFFNDRLHPIIVIISLPRYRWLRLGIGNESFRKRVSDIAISFVAINVVNSVNRSFIQRKLLINHYWLFDYFIVHLISSLVTVIADISNNSLSFFFKRKAFILYRRVIFCGISLTIVTWLTLSSNERSWWIIIGSSIILSFLCISTIVIIDIFDNFLF